MAAASTNHFPDIADTHSSKHLSMLWSKTGPSNQSTCKKCSQQSKFS